jgi:hypothetical protein
MSEQSLKAALDGFESAAAAVYHAKDARRAIDAEDELAIAFARVVANLCDNNTIAADFDVSNFDEPGEPSGLEKRITLRLGQLRAERRRIAMDKREAAAGAPAHEHYAGLLSRRSHETL